MNTMEAELAFDSFTEANLMKARVIDVFVKMNHKMTCDEKILLSSAFSLICELLYKFTVLYDKEYIISDEQRACYAAINYWLEHLEKKGKIVGSEGSMLFFASQVVFHLTNLCEKKNRRASLGAVNGSF